MLRLDAVTLVQGAFQLEASFDIDRGERVAIIGPSGAGKSTLLSAIAGFLPPASGRIWIDGHDVTEMPPAKRPVSIVFQDTNLFAHMTAFDNVALGIKPSLRLSATEKSQVADALDRVGLSGFETRKPGDLSGGQQSRVALARVLLRRTPLVLLDEPFAALGPGLKQQMLELVSDILAETEQTMIMVTHDPADALAISTKTVLVADGTARPPRATKALLNNPPPELRTYLGTPPTSEGR